MTTTATPDFRTLERTGLIGPDGRFVAANDPHARLVLPGEARVEGDELLWSWFAPGEGGSYRWGQPDGALEAFRRINDADAVLRFARRYGVLMLCDHGLPASHNPSRLVFGELGCRPAGWRAGRYREPIRVWLHYARQAEALLTIAALLRHEHPVPPRVWASVFEDQPQLDAGFCDKLSADATAGRGYLVEIVNAWLSLGDVTPRVRWFAATPKPRFEFQPGVFGALAFQLMLAVTSASAAVFCDGCHRWYPRQGRKPQAGRRNYCGSEECRKLAARERQRVSRARRAGS